MPGPKPASRATGRQAAEAFHPSVFQWDAKTVRPETDGGAVRARIAVTRQIRLEIGRVRPGYDPSVGPQELIDTLGLQQHPEGGWYRETWRAEAAPGERAAGSAIYFLLRAGDLDAWHRVDAAETWHWYAGAPLALAIVEERSGGRSLSEHVLGADIAVGQRPQIVVPPAAWQQSATLGA